MAMDPLVTAAWIAAGTSIVSLAGTVAVAIVGFRAAEKVGSAANAAAASNTKHFVNATRDDHLWEKRARAYEDVLAHTTFRSLRVDLTLRPSRLNKREQEGMEKLFEVYGSDSWLDVHARMLAYASAEVLEAFLSASDADPEAALKLNAWKSKADHNRNIVESGAIPNTKFSEQDLSEAERDAAEAEEVRRKLIRRVTELIRAELHSSPRTIAPVPGEPGARAPERRGRGSSG